MKLLSSASVQLLLCGFVLEALYLALIRQGDLRFRIPETAGLLLLLGLFYLVSVYIAEKTGETCRRQMLLLIVAPALLFRLTAWIAAPALSDDAFRYRWEGMVQAAGGNPYQSRPIDERWAGLRDETFPRVGGKEVKAGYGPLLELIEAATYRGANALTEDPHIQAHWFKVPSALFDLGILAALAALLAAHGLPAGRLLVYAWSPLAVVEFWGTGHNDAVAVFFVVLALLLAEKERWWWAFTALSLAACAKIWPLVLFPIFIGWRGWRPCRWYQWTVLAPIAVVLALPYWSDVSENADFMTGFMGGWRNNDSLYGLLLWITGDQYPAKHTAMGIVVTVALLVTLLRWSRERASLTVVVVMLLVSSNCHPWYLTWILPLLAFHPVSGLLLWTVLAPLAYRVVIDWALLGRWEGSTPWRWWIYGPVFAMLTGSGVAHLIRRQSRQGQTTLS